MIGLDTNILLRAFVADESRQARSARAFLAERCTADNPGFINLIVLCEFVWTLKHTFQFGRPEIAQVIRSLLDNVALAIESEEHVAAALGQFGQRSLDFPDLLIGHINRAHGCSATITFDRKAAKLAGFRLLS